MTICKIKCSQHERCDSAPSSSQKNAKKSIQVYVELL